MVKVHKFKRGEDYTNAGQTEWEYRHTTECGYTRKKVTLNDAEVTCKKCLKQKAV